MHENTSTVGYDLFYKYVDLVFKIVKRMNFTSCDREDLIQAGLMGLHQATKKYDPSRNVKFSTYATYYIVGEIKKEIRNSKMIKLSKEMYQIIKKIKSVDQNISISSLSNHLNVSKEKILLALNYQDQIISLNKKHEDTELLGLIPDDRNRFDFMILSDLDKKSQEVIMLKYYKGYTQEEIAKKLNLSQSKISRLENLALKKLRNSQ
ncbi:MAG TPA: sigma-70 family RNA polymerase sigma factor [Acholeplasmataceae bacterium]|nr:sigma-70 family RNA polymerase sigma factor [Acholeplasmataceae bacterium]